MPAYVVRMIEEHDLVGLYFAETLEQLQDMVDEACNIDICEFAQLPPGGVQWEVPAIEIPVPRNPDPEADPNDGPFIPWKDASATAYWSDALYSGDGLSWEPLFPEAQPAPPPPKRPRRRKPKLRVVI